MKKQYIAPDLCFESFELSQSIAAGCATQGIGAAKLWNELWGYFTTSETQLTCTLTDFDDDDFESYCYWQGSIKMFLS